VTSTDIEGMTWWRRGDLQHICSRERAVIELGPLAAPGRLTRLAPFAAVLTVTLPVVLFDAEVRGTLQVVVTALYVLTVGAAGLAPWALMPRGAQSVFPFVPMCLLFALVQLTGAVDSPFRPLLLVPLFWLMLYETRRSLWLAMMVTAGFVVSGAIGTSTLDVSRRVVPIVVGLVLLPMIWRIVAVHREAVVTLAELSEHDSLTGVLNRRGLDRRVRAMQGESFEGLGVLYLDVDDFKAVNDRLGHDAGDELLCQIGGRLTSAARRSDAVARVGGDEFVLVRAGDRAGAASLRDRVGQLINDAPYALHGKSVVASVSVGLSFTESVPDQVSTLIRAADLGMFSAKAASTAAASRPKV
jgi:diguanylate cyclase (GGDEF)-like protein